MKNIIFLFFICTWLAMPEAGFAAESLPDFKQAVNEFSSDKHLNMMFSQSVQSRAEQLFTLVEKSIAKGEKEAIKLTISKRKVAGLMDTIDWDVLIERWYQKMQIKR